MQIEETKVKRYLLGELYWELEQHTHLSSPFTGVDRESVEVLTFGGYDDLRVRVAGVVYDVHLSWNPVAPPVITRVEDTHAA
jgi:hypothetical protein